MINFAKKYKANCDYLIRPVKITQTHPELDRLKQVKMHSGKIIIWALYASYKIRLISNLITVKEDFHTLVRPSEFKLN